MTDRLTQYRGFSVAMNHEITKILESYGLVNTKINARIGQNEVKITIETDWQRADGKTPEAIRYEQMASAVGLKPEWLGQTFRDPYRQNTYYKVIGLLQRRSDKIVQIEHTVTGKVYVATPEMVKLGFALQNARAA